jgi:ribonucleoside-diphosphate reductase alpha chain
MVHDSKEGWAKALRQLIALLYSGEAAKWDVSEIRPKGARLKIFGGRASGPGPLEDLFRFVTRIFKGAQGRRLTSIECHDIMCKIGEVVVVGGVAARI